MQCPNESENFGYDRRPAARLDIESDANPEPGLCAARHNGGAEINCGSTNPTKCRLASPNRCSQAFAEESAGSMPARYIRIVTDRIQAHRISICAAYGQTPMH
jgi:hypothetical protein